jgi:hypothetical protein
MSALRDELAAIGRQLEALEARRGEIYRQSLAAPAAEKVCDDRMAEMLAEVDVVPELKFPIEVSGIAFEETSAWEVLGRRVTAGDFVAVRPCDPSVQGRTLLGIYLGRLSTHAAVRFDRASGVLGISRAGHNPAIWVPTLRRVVMGFESWWRKIESPDDLRQITDQDIAVVPYMQMLREMVGGGGGPPA